ncbi:MAG TPA: glycine cleavage system protein T [Firmicutes bacterium]|nr:glycine cleavage system protein T [Bacillota bacterium]
MAQRTPFYELHIEAGAKMIEFAGWEMPLHYGDMLEEHRRVREACGLFDLSHMGEIVIDGPRALEVVQLVTTNDASVLEAGQAQYSLVCREDGGILDDILVYRLDDYRLGDAAGPGRAWASASGACRAGSRRTGGGNRGRGRGNYLLVVNAANTTRDYAWIRDQWSRRCRGAGTIKWFYGDRGVSNLSDTAGEDAASDFGIAGAGWDSEEDPEAGAGIRNCSSDMALLAIQGPRSQEVLQRLTGLELESLRYYWCARGEVAGVDSLVSRTGYTGEDGFEIYFDPSRGQAAGLWDAILDAGREFGIIPCGLGARDTLRLEAGYPLYGHELTEEINPFEAGLGWVVKSGKGDFIGREALAGILSGARGKPAFRRLFGFKLKERGVPRAGCELRRAGSRVGTVTSGTLSPTLGVGIGLGYLFMPITYGDEISVVIRGREVRAEITKIPFVPSRVRR